MFINYCLVYRFSTPVIIAYRGKKFIAMKRSASAHHSWFVLQAPHQFIDCLIIVLKACNVNDPAPDCLSSFNHCTVIIFAARVSDSAVFNASSNRISSFYFFFPKENDLMNEILWNFNFLILLQCIALMVEQLFS